MSNTQTRTIAFICISSCATFGCLSTEPNDFQSVKKKGAERIVGGHLSDIDDRQYQVSLHDDMGHFCGGALISSQWVLTAAHCVRGFNRKNLWVVTGTNNWKDDDDRIGVRKIVQHAYNSHSSANDIALLQLEHDPKPGTTTTLALPSAEVMREAAAPGDMLTVSGWGYTKGGGRVSTLLRETDVPMVDNNTCNSSQSYGGDVLDSMLCAGYARGGKDSCQGDSGGPLVATYQGKTYSIGVVSWGEGCAAPNKYGVYARTAVFSEWIKKETGISNGLDDGDVENQGGGQDDGNAEGHGEELDAGDSNQDGSSPNSGHVSAASALTAHAAIVDCHGRPRRCRDIGSTSAEQLFGCCENGKVYWCKRSWKVRKQSCGKKGRRCGYNAEKDWMACID